MKRLLSLSLLLVSSFSWASELRRAQPGHADGVIETKGQAVRVCAKLT